MECKVGLTQLMPCRDFIGLDVKVKRRYIGAKKCLAEKSTNAGFLRTEIENLATYFAMDEVDEI